MQAPKPNKQYYRKEFLQLLGALGVGYVVSGCNSPSNKTEATTEAKDTVSHQANQAADILNSNNVVLVTKADNTYDELRLGFNKRIDNLPGVIAVCKNTEGVAEAIQYAREQKLKVAVKSGGHSMEGYSGNNGGMVINLSLMSSIEWLNDTEVKLGPAVKLGQLYDDILPRKRIIPAGSCGTVGVGGLTLGGGYGFFCRELGLTCDSLKELTLVDGYGKIHHAKNNDEILWACRGGGNGNFGVVTEMIFETHAAPESFTSHRFRAYNLHTEKAASLLKNWFEVTATLPKTCFSAFVLNQKTLLILVTNFGEHIKEVEETLAALGAVTDKTSLGKPRPLADALKTFYGIQHPIYFKNACAGMYTGFESVEGCINEVMEKVTTTPGIIYQVNTFGGKVMDEELAKNSCFAHRAFPYLSELQSYWDKPSQQQKLVTVFNSIQTAFAENGVTAHYCNYPDAEFANPQLSYYGGNYKRLREIKRRLDGDNIISHPQSVRL